MPSLFLVTTHFLLPLGLILWLALGTGSGRYGWVQLLLVCTYLSFILMVGRWGAVSFYLPVSYVLLLSLSLYRIRKKKRKSRSKSIASSERKVSRSLWLALMLLAGLNGLVLSGYFPAEEALHLTFPFGSGVYQVWNGGHSRLINQCPIYNRQPHAVDIVKLNRAGLRVRRLQEGKFGNYEIWGEIVQSPCNGTVVKVKVGQPDRPSPKMHSVIDVGNMVALQCAGVTLYFLHLLDGSIHVKEGNILKTGDSLGIIGNSGDSYEPHLHIHAEQGGQPGILFSGKSVPMLFDGRYLVRNSLIFR